MDFLKNNPVMDYHYLLLMIYDGLLIVYDNTYSICMCTHTPQQLGAYGVCWSVLTQ